MGEKDVAILAIVAGHFFYVCGGVCVWSGSGNAR